MELDTCPECGSHEIDVNMRGSIIPHVDKTTGFVSAARVDKTRGAFGIQAECQSCGMKLRPTAEGYRKL